MQEDQSDIQEKLRLLRENYAASLPEKIHDIVSAWKQLCASPAESALMNNLVRLCHTLAGSGTSFGFPEVTRLSRHIEQIMVDLKDNNKSLNEERITTIIELLTELEGQADLSAKHQTQEDYAAKPAPRKRPADNKLVYLIEDDQHLCDEISLQLGYYSYQVVVFTEAATLKDAITKKFPASIIMDINLPDTDGIILLKQIKETFEPNLPSIVISTQSDTRARLNAVRAGADAFFSKPFDMAQLIDTLDTIVRVETSDPYRVMIVDDSESAADFYSYSLQQAGIETIVATNPMDVMQKMSEFNPELLLLDLYMPECTGIELAKVIRQHSSYVGTPIVFLSAETNTDRQLTAMSHGGDDFLTKPIQASHLVSTITSRIQRYRELRSFMVRDSLTGLYKHTSLIEILEREISRARRNNNSLCYVMIDIDHFKKVNDNYGHATGDNVIKILSRLLKQRLRGSDYIGRYGGEEFAIILPDTEEATAERIINELRENFSSISIKSENKNVSCTFSAGIAAYPEFKDPAIINHAADKALYTAKKAGRNCVKTSNPG